MSKLAELEKLLAKEIGENDENQGVTNWLSTGYLPLDKAIGGKYRGKGMPVGRIVEMFGPPSSGKTAVVTQVMANAQAAGGIAMFQDHERSFAIDLAKNLGLKDVFPQWIYKRPRTYEESCDMAVAAMTKIRSGDFIDPKAPIVIAYDSLASMIPKSKSDKDSADFNMNDNTALARATSSNFPALAQFSEEYGVLMIFLNQARTKIGVMFGDPTTTPGGNAPEFYSSVRIKLGRSQITTGTGESKIVIGQEIGAQCIKNKVSRPFEKAKWRFLFNDDGSGKFDVIGSTINHCLEEGFMEKDGTRIVWEGGKYTLSQLTQRIEKDGSYEELTKLLVD